jgi:hypothetical protein
MRFHGVVLNCLLKHKKILPIHPVTPEKIRDNTFRFCPISSFQILTNSLLTTRPKIRLYVVSPPQLLHHYTAYLYIS